MGSAAQSVFRPQQTTYQSTNPYGANYRPPTGPQGAPAGPITPQKAAVAGGAPVETEEERRRRQALILGSEVQGLGDGGDGSGGAASAGDSGGDGTGGGTGGTY